MAEKDLVGNAQLSQKGVKLHAKGSRLRFSKNSAEQQKPWCKLPCRSTSSKKREAQERRNKWINIIGKKRWQKLDKEDLQGEWRRKQGDDWIPWRPEEYRGEV